MIIRCINCNKQFQVKSDLIPSKGRTIQCGSCQHLWFFKKDQKDEALFLDKKDELEIKKSKKEKKENTLKKIDFSKNDDDKALIKYEKKTSFTIGLFIRYILVFIISFVALIIFLDTLKAPLSNYIPNLELILFNLNETIKDIFLFLNDLIK